MTLLANIEGTTRFRWLLLGSLALNLAFVGAAGAVAFRYSGPVPLATISRIDHNVTGRLDSLAASLPENDATLLRAQLRTDAVKIATAQADLRLSREEVRKNLRAEPFDAAAMRAALEANRVARDHFAQVLQNAIASAAGRMSIVGRSKLADWPNERDRRLVQQ